MPRRTLHKRRKAAKDMRKRLARSRIEVLWKEALLESRTKSSVAQRHVLSARRIAQRARTKLPPEMRRSICKECGAVLVQGQNSRVRVRSNRARHLTVTCLSCGAVRRFYLPERTQA